MNALDRINLDRLRFFPKGNKIRSLKLATALLLAQTAVFAVHAEPVVIKSLDGSVAMSGEIIGVTGEFITLRTAIGDMRFAHDQFICEGEDCPDDPAEADDDVAGDIDFTFKMIASAGIADQLLPVIAQGIAEKYEANAIATDSFGKPLPEDIGRPRIGKDDDDDEEGGADGDDDDEVQDIIDIRLQTENDEIVLRYGVIIEEEEEAFEELSEGDVHIIFLDEPAEAEYVADVLAGGGGRITDPGQERVLAVEGLAVAVSPQNSLTSISADAIPQIFAGEITNWKELGGPDAPINVYSFDEDNAAIHYVDELVLEPADAELGDDIIAIQTMSEMTGKIFSDPFGIGVVPFGNLRGTKALPVASGCGIVNTPSAFSIKTEEYVMQRRFYAYNRKAVSTEEQEFLDFLDSEGIDDLVRKAGFIDLSVVAQPQQENSARTQDMILAVSDPFELNLLRDMLGNMRGTQRLSTDFRFAFGSSQLDTRAVSDIDRLVSYIGANRPSEVVFVGFTDSVGSFGANRRLSQGRAETVRRQIAAKLPVDLRGSVQFRMLGYGELAPVACNESNKGRGINRRVEVWIK